MERSTQMSLLPTRRPGSCQVVPRFVQIRGPGGSSSAQNTQTKALKAKKSWRTVDNLSGFNPEYWSWIPYQKNTYYIPSISLTCKLKAMSPAMSPSSQEVRAMEVSETGMQWIFLQQNPWWKPSWKSIGILVISPLTNGIFDGHSGRNTSLFRQITMFLWFF